MKFYLKVALGLLCLTAFTSNASASVFLTSFGNTAAPTYLLDGSTTFSTTQSAASLQISGLDNGTLVAGSFNPISIVGNTNILTLTGSTTVAPGSPFNMTLFDNTGKAALYKGSTWAALSGGSTSATFFSNDGGFNFASVVAFEIDTSGVGSNINATLTGLSAGVSAVPEPSRALLGMLGIGLVAIRRRRRRR